jgi:hypothetical protein
MVIKHRSNFFLSPTDFQILLSGNVPRSQFVVDVHINELVNGRSQRGESLNPQLGYCVDSTLAQQEEAKIKMHVPHYDYIVHRGLLCCFVASCFGVLGAASSRMLMALASLKLRQHQAYRSRSGHDPLPEEPAHSQFPAICIRQSSARLGHASARDTVQRLLATPSLPLVRSLPLPQLEIALTRLILSPLFLPSHSPVLLSVPPSS